MERFVSLLFVLFTCCGAVSAQPATAPVTSEHLFADDTLRFSVPTGWRLVKISNDSRWAEMKRDDGAGTLVLNTTPQTASLTQDPDTRIKLGEQIVKQMHDGLVAERLQIVDRPRIARDEAFFLRVPDRYRARTERAPLISRLHVYRVMGIHLIMAVATAFDESPDAVAAVHTAGEQLLYSVKANKVTRNRGVPTGSKPSLFRKAKVKLAPTKGWLEDKSDTASGTIAVYRQPIGSAVVSVRVVPPADIAADRAASVERIAKDELTALAPPDATAGEVQRSADAAFFLMSRQDHSGVRPAVRVENRIVAVGAVLLSITSASVEVKADDVSAWADELARTAESFER